MKLEYVSKLYACWYCLFEKFMFNELDQFKIITQPTINGLCAHCKRDEAETLYKIPQRAIK